MATPEHHSDEVGAGTPVEGASSHSVTPFYRFAYYVSTPVVRGLYRLRARGLDQVPKTGGYVVAANHTSNLDPWPLGMALWPRQLHFMAKSELWWPGLRTLLRWTGAFPVRRGEGDVEAIETAVRLCRDGRVMVMFPEGTRRAKGLRKRRQPRVHTGTARIALAADVPIVPAAIGGMHRLSRLGPLEVVFGPPVHVADVRGLDSRTAAKIVTERVWSDIQRLENELAHPPGRA